MKVQYRLTRSSRAPVKAKSQVQDDSIMGTNNSSIVSKRSVERIYYPNEPHFFRYFVKKPQRRSPLINRGYWLRMRAVDHVVQKFLEQESLKDKVVINLGCGYDPLPWQCLTRYPTLCGGVKFVDIDYKDLMLKKRDTVKSTKELNSLLTNMEVLEGDILLRSDQYVQLGCDLRDLKLLDRTLATAVDTDNCVVLLTAEVSITYMNYEAADALIQWASKFSDARFCLLEQLLPDGIDHPFAQTMINHFNKLQTPLRAVQKYPTALAQQERFKSLGWSNSLARNLWQLWNDSDFMTSQDRISLDILEPFDEWEEFALFGCHYFLLVADKSVALTGRESSNKDASPCTTTFFATQDVACPVEVEILHSENPKGQGYRRFAAALPIKCSKQTSDRVGIFAGMGLKTRVNTCDVYGADQPGDIPPTSHATSVVPSSRMCHTITDIGEFGALLVGGRTSPDNSLADCWLYHRWVDIWERVDDLPLPIYRHGAVSLGNGQVLISPGKCNSRDINKDFYIWSRLEGWRKCKQTQGTKPIASYGATFTVFETSLYSSTARRGLLAGGMSAEALLLDETWEWVLENPRSHEPLIIFTLATEAFSSSQPLSNAIARFGASVVSHLGQTWIVGGIVKDDILKESAEICMVDSQLRVSRAILSRPIAIPRPILIGSSVISIGERLLIIGGSAVCFSFGTSWNNGCYTLKTVDGVSGPEARSPVEPSWRFLHTVAVARNMVYPTEIPYFAGANSIATLPRMRIGSSADFDVIIQLAKPVVLESLDLGPCTELWTSHYLKENIGANREVVVHSATAQHMDFRAKNFTYSTKPFGDFIDRVDNGERLYLRSLSSEKPAEHPSNISRDFPSLAKDFQLPPQLALVTENVHSCPLRISGPVIMWLHYDVMANVLCQIRGSKKLLLFPPPDVNLLGFEPGASSSSINVFDNIEGQIPPNTHPYQTVLKPGDVLFLPPLWLHTTSPALGTSVAVNVFFRNLHSGYAAGKDVYGNRDLQAYERGRQDIAKIIKSFDSLPIDVRDFYLQRLVKEFEKAC